jgi:HTH-type transcriptional regulator/antitoxin HigA
VLNRKRSFSIGMIRRLHKQLGISADVLIRPLQKIRAA